MISFLRKFSTDQLLFFIISIIGIVLFSYQIHLAPLTTDELSAINRGNYNTLSEVFKYSISTDSHPPFSQLFLFYWVKIVGFNDLLIKLPFLLMGIGSIFLMYRISKIWFSKNSALLTIAFFVSIQLTIMYSQIARPYIIGLFLGLLFTLQWTKILENKAKIHHYILYIVIGTFCAYNHHLQTLQIAVIGLTGLFFIKKNQLLKYILVNGLLALLYIPNLSIMLAQMEVEGLAYLVKPDLKYIITYFYYIFQFSLIAVFITFLIIGISIYQSKKIAVNKYTLIAFLLFTIPMLIGYLFSVYVRPVIPYRALIFSFPFFVLFIYSFSQQLNLKLVTFFCSIIIIVNVYTLIFKRNHYPIFEKGISELAITNTNKLVNEYNDPYIIFNMAPFNIEYYCTQYHTTFKYDNLHPTPPSAAKFREKIHSLKNNVIIVCNLPYELLSIVKEYYPSTEFVDYGFNINYYCFSKNGNKKDEALIYDSILTFNSPEKLEYASNILIDSNQQNYYYHFNNDQEWGPSITIPLGEITQNVYSLIETSVTLLNPHKNDVGLLVFEIKNENYEPIWRSSELKNWLTDEGKPITIYYSVHLTELIKHKELSKNATLTIYYWNQSKSAEDIDNLTIKISKGNQIIYSLLEDFPN